MIETRNENMSQWCYNLLNYCLFTEEEVSAVPQGMLPDGALVTEGIIRTFGFHPGRIEEKKSEIKEILDQMPLAFHAEHGGGTSFLALCEDKDKNHWAEHPTMEVLVVLGIAAGMARYALPREKWDLFPAAMPYVTFDTRPKDERPAEQPKEVKDD